MSDFIHTLSEIPKLAVGLFSLGIITMAAGHLIPSVNDFLRIGIVLLGGFIVAYAMGTIMLYF